MSSFTQPLGLEPVVGGETTNNRVCHLGFPLLPTEVQRQVKCLGNLCDEPVAWREAASDGGLG